MVDGTSTVPHAPQTDSARPPKGTPPPSPGVRRGLLSRLSGIGVSVVFHGALAVIASLTWTHGAKRMGAAGAGESGDGEAGFSARGFEVLLREGDPQGITPVREPDPRRTGKVEPDVSPIETAADRPAIPFDAFSLPQPEDLRPGATIPLADPPLSRPRSVSAFLRLPKGESEGKGDASEGSTPGDERGASPVVGSGGTPAGIGPGSGGGGDGALLVLHGPKPEYPLRARRRRIEGVTIIEAIVGSLGDVISAQLLESSGCEDLDQSALAAVKQWRVERKAGEDKAGPLVQRIRCVFKLED